MARTISRQILRMLLLSATVISCLSPGSTSRLDSWEAVRNYSVRPVCVPIPRNMTLCQNIGYSRLRLPNLLQHESVSEILQQSRGWMPLMNLQCDQDTQLFLCSLYAPICLERHIYPCRSLCEKVEKNCGARMLQWGYPWPQLLRCDQFPMENDMCIKPQAHNEVTAERNQTACRVCRQPATKENIMDHYCRADIVLVAKIKRIKPHRTQCGKPRIFKPQLTTRSEKVALRRPALSWQYNPECCPAVRAKGGKLLIMANRSEHNQLIPTLILPWKNNRMFRSLRPLLRRLDCTDSRSIRQQVLPPISTVYPRPRHRKRGRSRAQRRRNKRRRLRKWGLSARTSGRAEISTTSEMPVTEQASVVMHESAMPSESTTPNTFRVTPDTAATSPGSVGRVTGTGRSEAAEARDVIE